MTGNVKKDERQHWLLTESLATAAFVAYFYGLILLVYKLIMTKDLKNVYVELGLITIMFITMSIHRILNKTYDIPSTISGKVLPTGSSKEEKRGRIIYYIKDSLKFSIIFIIFKFMWRGNKGFLFHLDNIFLGFLIEGVLIFIVIYIKDYLWYEYNVRRYNAYCESLEQE
jgi:hypothetical protein